VSSGIPLMNVFPDPFLMIARAIEVFRFPLTRITRFFSAFSAFSVFSGFAVSCSLVDSYPPISVARSSKLM
jgi:hypothetical protein